jgi:peptidoglycan/LPS O-acetylase OafA/YrhL
MTMRRLDSLEGLRFLSSIAIVAGHYIPYAVGETPWIGRLHLAVDLFFVISGIVIASNYADRIATIGDWCSYMLRRIARIYPLHLATLAFYVAIGILVWSGKVSPVDATRYNAASIIPNVMMIHAWFPSGVQSFNYVSWSISAEFFVYLAFPVIVIAVRGNARLTLVGIFLLFACFAWVAQTRIGLPLTRLGWQAGVLRVIPGFAFGVWLHTHRDRISALLTPAQAARALQLALVLVAVLCVVRVDQYATLAVIWMAVALAYICDRAGLKTWVSADWLASRGKLTYSIYMLHPLVATVLLAAVFPRIFGTSPAGRILGVLLALPLLYAVARASLAWFEQPARIAITRWGQQRLGAATERPAD